MNRKLICILFLGCLTVLSIFQITLDYVFDSERKNTEVLKNSEYCIFIEIEDKTLYLLQNGKCIREYLVTSGRSGLPSPLGMWKIVEKGDWGEGFGGSWMGLDIPWGTYGIHGSLPGDSMGIAASHGCIRMSIEDAAELYRLVPHGTPVIIVNGSFGPFGRAFAEINPGDRGADVYAIQQRLKELGFFKGYIDGIFEDDLKNALHRFQRSNKLPVTNTITKRAWEAMGFREFQ